MERSEYDALLDFQDAEPTISVENISSPDRDRTLLIGQRINGELFHVWLAGCQIHWGSFRDGQTDHISVGSSFPANRIIVADMAIFPDSSDSGFVHQLLRRGVPVIFGIFDEERGRTLSNIHIPFHGPTSRQG